MAREKKDISLNPFFHLNIGQFFIDEMGAQSHEFSRFGGTDEFSQRTILGQSIIERVRLAFATFHGAESFNSMGLLDYIFPATVFAHLSETTDSKPLSWLYSTLYFILEIPKFIISSVMTAAVLPMVILYHGIASTIWYFKYRDQQPEPECVDFPRLNPFAELEAEIEEEGFPRNEFPHRLNTLIETLYGIPGLMGIFDYVFPAAVFDYLSKTTTNPFLKFLANIPYAILSVPKFILTAVATIVLSPVVLITHWIAAAVHAVQDARKPSDGEAETLLWSENAPNTGDNVKAQTYQALQSEILDQDGTMDLNALLNDKETVESALKTASSHKAFAQSQASPPLNSVPNQPEDGQQIAALKSLIQGDTSPMIAVMKQSPEYQKASSAEKMKQDQIFELMTQGKADEAFAKIRQTEHYQTIPVDKRAEAEQALRGLAQILGNPQALAKNPAHMMQMMQMMDPDMPPEAAQLIAGLMSGDNSMLIEAVKQSPGYKQANPQAQQEMLQVIQLLAEGNTDEALAHMKESQQYKDANAETRTEMEAQFQQMAALCSIESGAPQHQSNSVQSGMF